MLVSRLACQTTARPAPPLILYRCALPSHLGAPNLFAAGDASRRPQQAIVAAAEGATAAFLVSTQLLKEDLA